MDFQKGFQEDFTKHLCTSQRDFESYLCCSERSLVMLVNQVTYKYSREFLDIKSYRSKQFRLFQWIIYNSSITKKKYFQIMQKCKEYASSFCDCLKAFAINLFSLLIIFPGTIQPLGDVQQHQAIRPKIIRSTGLWINWSLHFYSCCWKYIVT